MPSTGPIAVEPLPQNGLAPGTKVGEFVVEGQIGAGGMGVVYRATHPLIGKKAVIKVIKADLGGNGSEHVQRFIREARAVNQIGHPNIVDVFSFGALPDKRPYLVMEWLQGESLGTRLDRGKLPTREGFEILLQICSALDAAHTYGVIHRDLKPDNVYLVALPNDDRPLVKLLDFGLAKIAEANDELSLSGSNAGVILGTPSYLSPEQARGRTADHRSDIYTLGVMAFELLTGRRPFLGTSPIDTILMHVTAPPPHVRTLAPELPEEVDALLLSMMAKDPDQRPSLSKVRSVISAALGKPEAVDRSRELSSGEDEETGARTADFSPALRRAVSTGWTAELSKVAMSDLEERPAEDPTRADNEATRTDTDAVGGLGKISSDSAVTPARLPRTARPGPAATESKSSVMLSGVGMAVPPGYLSQRPGMILSPPEEPNDTRLQTPPGMQSLKPTAPQSISLHPLIVEEEATMPPPEPLLQGPPRSNSRAALDAPAPSSSRGSFEAAPRQDSRSSFDVAPRQNSRPSIDAPLRLPERPRGTFGSATAATRPLKEGLARLIGGASSGEQGRGALIAAAAAMAILFVVLGVALVRWSTNPHGAGDQVRLYVRGLPPNSTLTWDHQKLEGNPTFVPRSNEPKALSISSPGYETVKINDLVPDKDLEFSVELGAPRAQKP